MWLQQLLGWEDPKVAADPVGELSTMANRRGGFSAEDIAEIQAERLAGPSR